MMLHVPTVLVMLLLGYGMLALQISLTLRQANDTLDLRIWNRGSWALLGGFLALLTRNYVPVGLSILATSSLLYLGVVLYNHAIYNFLYGRGAPRALWWVWALASASSFFMLSWPRSDRAIVVSLVLAALILPALFHIFRMRQSSAHPLRMVGITFAATVLALTARAFHAWTVPENYGDPSQVSLVQGLTFIFAFVAMLGAGFGFILGVLERNVLRMHELATHDGLTGCINRTTFDAMLANTLQRAQRNGEPVSLVMLDLDHFKAINDQFGHRAGDEVLRRVAAVINEQLRTSDVLARVGGEEFCALLPATDTQGAAHVAESVRAAVQDLAINNLHNGTLAVTLSAGVASMGAGGSHSADSLYQRADEALYRAKAAGRNRVEVATVTVNPS